MIFSCNFTSGFPTELPDLKGKTFEFQPGLNLLTGPNGCGKSTLLRAIAAHTGIKGGGFNRVLRYGDIYSIHEDPKFPENFAKLAPGKCALALNWDGARTGFQDSRTADQSKFAFFFDSAEHSDDGMTSMADQLNVMTQHASAGQMRLQKLMQILEAFQKEDAGIPAPKESRQGDEVTAAHLAYWRQIYAGHKSHVPTILLDEPENALAMHWQILFWTRVVPRMAEKGYQVIMTSHSALAMFCPTPMHHIELQPGYNARQHQLLKSYVDGTLNQGTLQKAVLEIEQAEAPKKQTSKKRNKTTA